MGGPSRGRQTDAALPQSCKTTALVVMATEAERWLTGLLLPPSGQRGVAGADAAQAAQPGGAPPAGRSPAVQPEPDL